jgi:DNA modification methylase
MSQAASELGASLPPPSRRRVRFACVRCECETDAVPNTKRAKEQLCRPCFGKGEDRRPRELNGLSGREWAQASRSVEQYPDTRSEKQRQHGASFPQSLAHQQIEIYTAKGQRVLDPFVGVGTTLDACAELRRHGIGIDLNEEFVRTARADLEGRPGGELQKVIQGDAIRLTQYVKPNTIDFVLTSPPYGSLLKNVKGAFAYKWQEHSMIDSIPNPTPYSDHPSDLGNMDYGAFLDALTHCLAETWKVQRTGSYAVWVVKDFRALKERIPYVNFHGHFIERAESQRFSLWDVRIYDQTRYRPLVCLGYPSRNFYLNIGHSYLVVLRKT